LIGGEELHNNHHAFPTSAKLSARWFEFDIGWAYIRCLEILRLARAKRTIPVQTFDFSKTIPDLASLQAIVTHRYLVLHEYAKKMWITGKSELKILRSSHAEFSAKPAKQWWRLLWKDAAVLSDSERTEIQKLLNASSCLHTLYDFHRALQALWARSHLSQEESVVYLQTWCVNAQGSGIAPLENFSRYLTRFS